MMGVICGPDCGRFNDGAIRTVGRIDRIKVTAKPIHRQTDQQIARDHCGLPQIDPVVRWRHDQHRHGQNGGERAAQEAVIDRAAVITKSHG